MSLATIQSDKLTVTIASLGAEIQSIRDENGMERLFDGDPKYWPKRAPILFPVAGGFKDDGYEWQGKWYPMPKHGFVRPLEWKMEKADAHEAVFLTKEKDPGFPFAYELRAAYTVDGGSLDVRYTVTNRDTQPFCFSIGSHEAYATPEGIEAYEIVFDEEEALVYSPVHGNLNGHDTVVLADRARTLPLKYEYFSVDAMVFRSLKSRGVTLRSARHGRTVHVDYPEHPFLLLWTKPGAPYICIEPWCNGPDMEDAPAAIDQKPGFIRVEPGETAMRHHVITIG